MRPWSSVTDDLIRTECCIEIPGRLKLADRDVTARVVRDK